MRLFSRFEHHWANSAASAAVILVVAIVIQQSLADSLSVVAVMYQSPGLHDMADTAHTIWMVVNFLLAVPVVVAWFLQKREAFFISLIVAQFVVTAELLINVGLLVADPVVHGISGAVTLLRDNVLLILINVLIFSIWYYILDTHDYIKKDATKVERWQFLFPQRSAQIPGYDTWRPNYIDYLFLATVTIFTFGPADTLPLSRRAKICMAIEIIVSVLTLSVLLARALSYTG